ncbi:MAG: hypothetical protein U0X91_31280 [Spirosomataceae bacterium]
MFKKAVIAAIGSLPILFYFWYLQRFSTSLPNEDDIPAILAFINRAFPFSVESVRLLFIPFREHVILPAKIIAYLQVLTTGHMHLPMMILLGNLFWVRVAWLLYAVSKTAKLPALYFLPVPFLLFQVQFSETALWPMALWSNLIVVWLAVESFRLLITSKKEWRQFGGAFLLALAATFSNGNGLLVFLIGFGILLYRKADRGRVVLWLTGSVISIALYGWAKSSGVPDSYYGVQTHPLKWVLGSMIFVGNYGDFVSGSLKTAALALGFVLTTAVLAIHFLQFKKSTYAASPYFLWFSSFLFILLTGAAVALLRTEPVGLDAMYLGRYRHYSALAVALVYLTVVSYLYPKRAADWLFYGTLGLSVLVGALSYYKDWGYRYMDNQRFFTDAYNMQYNNTLYVEKQEQMAFPAIFRETLRKNLLASDLLPLLQKRSSWLSPPQDAPLITADVQIDSLTDSTRCLRVYRVETDRPAFVLKSEEMWVWLLKSEHYVYVYPSTSLKTKPGQFFRDFTYFKPGFAGELATCRLPKEEYQLFLVNLSGTGELHFFRTDQMIRN